MARKKKQGELPGIEAPSHPDVDAAAEKFLGQRRSHAKSGQKVKEFRQNLIDEMRKAGLKEYRDNDADPPLYISLEDDYKVSVKELKHERPDPKQDGEQAE